MDYRAVLTLDYTGGTDPNAYAQLLNALAQAGWSYAETSAMYIESDDMTPIRLGMELLARAASVPGTISALDLQVQLIGVEREPPAAENHRRALSRVLSRPLPSEGSN